LLIDGCFQIVEAAKFIEIGMRHMGVHEGNKFRFVHTQFISNEFRMPIVAVGTNEALFAMQTDPQIASLFEPFGLPKWRESAELRAFVFSYGRLLPQK